VVFPDPDEPTIAVLPQTSARVFGVATGVTSFQFPIEPFGRSLVRDLNDAGPIEMLVAMRGEPETISLGLLQLVPLPLPNNPLGFLPIGNSLEGNIFTGAESPKQIRTLAFDAAFPATAPQGGAKAAFVVHETEIDGTRERRLSTRLIGQTGPPGQTLPLLLPPDAGDPLPFPIHNLVGGSFDDVGVQSGGTVRDLALVRLAGTSGGVMHDDEVVIIENDGFGGTPSIGNKVEFPGLLPDSPRRRFVRYREMGLDPRMRE
jgi:hypothetical protein